MRVEIEKYNIEVRYQKVSMYAYSVDKYIYRHSILWNLLMVHIYYQ